MYCKIPFNLPWMIIPILILSPLNPMASSLHQFTNHSWPLCAPWPVLYLKLGVGSRIFDVGLMQLNVKAAEFSRAVQGNLKRSLKTSSDQLVLKPANLTRVTSPRSALMVCNYPGACKGDPSDHQLKGASSCQFLLSRIVRKCWQPALKILTGREFGQLAMLYIIV